MMKSWSKGDDKGDRSKDGFQIYICFIIDFSVRQGKKMEIPEFQEYAV